MKILMVNDKLESVGGAEQDFLDEAEGLRNRGHRVTLASESDSSIPNIITKENIELATLHNVFDLDIYTDLIKQVPTVHYIHDHRTYSIGSSRYHFNSNTICEEPLSLVHSLVYAYSQKCASRNPLKTISLFNKKKALVKIHNKLSRVVANSSYVKKLLVKNGVSESKISVVYPAVKIKLSNKKITKDKPVVMFAGRLFIEKGAEYLIRAMEFVEGAEAWVTGDGWDKERLINLTKSLGLEDRVKFLGWVRDDEIGSYYQAADIGVVPSIWPEPFGLSGVNFMSFGKPVVGFDSGAISEWLVNDKTGYLVERLDYKALAGKINELLSDSKIAKTFGENGRQEYGKRFSPEVHLNNIERIYKDVLS